MKNKKIKMLKHYIPKNIPEMTNFELMRDMYKLLKSVGIDDLPADSNILFNDLYWEIYDRFVKKDLHQEIGDAFNFSKTLH